MIFAINKVPKSARKNAAPAVIPASGNKSAFTLLELMAVIVIIGILSSLAYASLMELIFTNRAKETAQTMRVFAERALAEGKRQGKTVTIALDGNSIFYSIDGNEANREPLSGGFTLGTIVPDCVDDPTLTDLNGISSELKIGISGMTTPGYFVACGARSYCAAAVKARSNNSFVACIRRGASASWEEL